MNQGQYMLKYALLAVLVQLLLSNTSKGQQINYGFNNYGFDQGLLTPSTIRTAYAKNKIWITCNDGLICYNGKNFDLLKHNYLDKSSLADNKTAAIVADKNETIWVSAGAFLDKLNPITQQFEHCYYVKDNKKECSFSIKEIVYDKKRQKIWFTTPKGVYNVDINSLECKKAFTDQAVLQFQSNWYYGIDIDSSGTVWLCNNDGFDEYHPEQNTIVHHNIINYKKGKAQGLLNIFIDNEQIVWMGTWTNGLISYEPKTNKCAQYFYSNHLKENNAILFIGQNNLAKQSGFIWVTAIYKGFGLFNKKTKKFEFQNSSVDNSDKSKLLYVNDMLQLADNSTYISSESGFHSMQNSGAEFSTVDLQKIKQVFAAADPINSFCVEKKGLQQNNRAYFELPYDQGYAYDFGQNKLENLPQLIRKYFDAMHHTVHFAASVDAQNKLWISTAKYGVVAYDINDNKMVVLDNQLHIDDNILNISEGPNDMWLTGYKGLYSVNKNSYVVRYFDKLNKQLLTHHNSSDISSFTLDSKENCWLVHSTGNTKSNIVYYNQKKEQCTFYNEGNSSELKGINTINDIVRKNDTLYYLSSTDGLLQMKITQGTAEFTLLKNKHNLSYNNINQITIDKYGTIWCSCLYGLQSYTPNSEETFVCYPFASNGLSCQKHPELFYDSIASNLYFITRGAIHKLHVQSHVQNLQASQLSFTRFSVKDSLVHNEYEMRQLKQVTLPYSQNKISVQFALNSFYNSEENQYAWKLDGLENDWHYAKLNQANYNYLPPGTYTLCIKAADCYGNWTPQQQLAITINPPFYKTWWFSFLSIAALGFSIYWLVKNYYRRKLEKQKLQNKIAADLHDEIGSTLTSINILSNVASQAFDKSPEKSAEMIKQIFTQSKQAQQNMSDIVWSIRADNDTVEDLIIRIKEYVSSVLEPADIDILFEIEENATSYNLPIQHRKEILLIIKEAVNNVVKHASCTQVIVIYKIQNGKIVLAVQDNGQWKNKAQSSGLGLLSMSRRAESIGGTLEISDKQPGTRVSLVLPITSIR
jgi:ligand-binding sensor domain-containing protein/two-component sensor histidine kinase